MRILGIIGYAFVALVLGAGWAFLYWQSSSVDLPAVEAARGALAELRAIDSGWNQRLVDARLHAQPPPPQRSRYRITFSALEGKALQLGDPRVGGELVQLKRAFDDKAALVDRYTAARADTQGAEAADAIFEQAWLAPTEPHLDTLARTISRSFDDALTESELYRVGLLYYSGFLLTVLAFLAWNLDQRRRLIDRINAQLRVANETLEARVRARTRELSDALARLKESEAMLIQSEKMSSLGQMVAGIAHEVNTPLAYVKSSLEAVRKSVPQVGSIAAETERLLALLAAENADETALAAQFALVRALVEELRGRNALQELERMVKDGLFGIGQISEVISNLKNFSRLDRSKIADYDLHEGIESVIRIGYAQLQKRTVRREFGKIPHVSCSPSQINQVILNLLSNAAQATKDGEGTITVRTGMRDAAHVAVEVADNGHGIPADVLPKIFDPFFTTKAVGKGTGLGLAICYKIVENHGGKLEVQSKPGLGTRFILVLPVNPPAALAA
ncbi:MAG TPA: ATP-binding protein [Burkholderiales bacterium]|nr:ATP-binding protein [Burkholderiales bacterium]